MVIDDLAHNRVPEAWHTQDSVVFIENLFNIIELLLSIIIVITDCYLINYLKKSDFLRSNLFFTSSQNICQEINQRLLIEYSGGYLELKKSLNSQHC